MTGAGVHADSSVGVFRSNLPSGTDIRTPVSAKGSGLWLKPYR